MRTAHQRPEARPPELPATPPAPVLPGGPDGCFGVSRPLPSVGAMRLAARSTAAAAADTATVAVAAAPGFTGRSGSRLVPVSVRANGRSPAAAAAESSERVWSAVT